MEYRLRRAIAMRIAPLLTGIVLAAIFYRQGMPVGKLLMKELAPLLGLALLFGPLLVGLYFARRSSKPDKS